MTFPNDHVTCVMPWDSFRILPSGQMQYCDASAEQITPHRTETDLVDWWRSGKEVQVVRQQMRLGQELNGCARCRHAESIDGVSFRTRKHFQAAVHHGSFFRDSLEQSVFWNSMQNDQVLHLPSRITVSFSNECNSRCIMCNPDSSDLVAQDHQYFGFTDSAPQLTQWWDSAEGEIKYQSLLRMVIDNPRLMDLQINGGEPFLQKIVTRFLQDIVDAGKTDCTLIINTNGTVWNHGLVSNMKKFGKCIVDFAIETVSESNDYLRWGSRIAEVKAMIDRYKRLQDNKFHVMLHCVPQALSMPDFHTLIDYCCDNDLLLIGNPLFKPSHLAIMVLPKEVRQDIAHNLMHRYNIRHLDLACSIDHAAQTNIMTQQQENNQIISDLPIYLHDLVVKIIKNLMQPDVPHIRDLQMALVNHVSKFDVRHHKDFKNSFPNLANFYQNALHA